ncbi:MAG: hypothetical protein E7427_05600 [Ruminococcaceae bacterium]|nr:hypothetical protein [Oscillospiraceae bacterium]
MKKRLQEFLLDMDIDRKKLLFILGGAVLTVLLLVIVGSALFGGNGRKYDRLYKEAEAAYLSHDYAVAEEKLRSAMELKNTEKAYLLMADIYTAQGETDRAVELLYLGYSRVGGDALSEKLEELKSAQNGGAASPAPQGAVTVAGMSVDGGASSLVLNGNGLSSADRSAISTLTNMESLSISDCGISDLGFLSDLKKLTFLQISDNAVRDLSPLSALERLKTLYIDNNPITDLAPLQHLTNLRTLSMKGIAVTQEQLDALREALPKCSVYADAAEDAGPKEITLGGRTFSSDVKELNLGGLGITDISALSDCTELEKLDLRDNKIEDISPLVELPNLKWLCIWNNKVTDINPLLSLRGLEYLDADGNEISDLSVLEYLTELDELWLNNNPIRSFEPLRGLTKLTRLGLAETGLDDEGLDCLMQMTELKELNIKRNEGITKKQFEALQKVIPNCVIGHDALKDSLKLGDLEFEADVEELNAANLGISDIAPLAGCAKLREVHLENNKISDIAPLAECTALQKLYLSGNSVANLSPLAACDALEELDLSNNSVTDLSALSALRALRTLHLSGNRLSDLSALYGLTNLEHLYLRGCGLTADDILELQTMLPRCVVIHDVALSQEDLAKTPGATPPSFPTSGSDLR